MSMYPPLSLRAKKQSMTLEVDGKQVTADNPAGGISKAQSHSEPHSNTDGHDGEGEGSGEGEGESEGEDSEDKDIKPAPKKANTKAIKPSVLGKGPKN